MPKHTLEIPRLSLMDYTHGDRAASNRFVQQVGKAFGEFGFLRLGEHGVPQTIIDRAYKEAKRFFKLSRTAKMAYHVVGGGGQRGYTPFGSEHAKGSKLSDLKEFYHVGQTLATESMLLYGYADNVHVNENSCALFLPTMQTLYSELQIVSYKVMCAVATYFSLSDYKLADCLNQGNSILRALHYPPMGTGHDQRSEIRAAAHEDINLITILCEATGPGLQILTRQGVWLPVHALDGEFVVNVGDMLARVTNNVFPSTTHRVVNPEGEDVTKSRFSMPFFAHPYPTYELKALDVCNPEGDALAPITAGAFLQQRLREIGLVK